MKKTFLAGLATLLPMAVTIFIVLFLVDFVTAPFVGIVEDSIKQHGTPELTERHHYLVLLFSRIIILVLFFILIFVLGVLGRKIFFSWLINLTEYIFKKIPIIKSIYKISSEISNSVLVKKQEKLFKGTVTVPFPHKNVRALGLLSGPAPKEVEEKKKELEAVFVPTAPHPISGFLLLYNQEEITSTSIETEDLFKFLLSCGIYKPEEDST